MTAHRAARGTACVLAAAVPGWCCLLLFGVLPTARFTRERIEVTVRPSSIEVEGLYVYANPWPIPVTQGLKYPILSDEPHPLPDSVLVTEADPGTGEDLRVIPTLRLGGTPYYSVTLPARASRHIRVRYSQRARGGSGVYLLSTTGAWRRPLESGEYLLKTVGVRITSSSYPLDGPGASSFARRSFMPDKEWEFTWIES
ncbi:MAG: hypothetical protein HY924_07110 [Elusimicrobia bacterium]|nr:hypothetical protein [Elusimicrobiota bacterium]